jgi:hypothetical protein
MAAYEKQDTYSDLNRQTNAIPYGLSSQFLLRDNIR